MDDPEIRHRFAYHPPDEAKAAQHSQVRSILHDVAQTLGEMLPDGRERAVALTKLEEAMFWANAAIARDTEVTVD